MNYRRSLVILLLFCPLIYVQAKDAAIVAGRDTAANGLHSADIAKAIKGSSHKMPNGKPMIIVLKPAQSVETRIFGEKCLGQNEKELSALISSEHALFRVVASDQEVIKAVNAIPGSIGLVDVYSINSSVTVLKIDNKSPLEPGYLFHGN
jgi:ABC-type phosphate transport system substrate-binding protein